MTVAAARRRAARRLATPEGQRLFDDFVDQDGRALALNVKAAENSTADILASLYLVDGDATIRCHTDLLFAFTAPGSGVIHVCGERFIQFALKTKGGEILLIHELLHSLGLGENPPTTSRITNAVLKRCG